MSRLAQQNPQTSRRLAGTVGGVALLLLASTPVLLFLDRNRPVPSVATTWGVPAVADVVSSMAVPVLGILIAVKKPANPIGWLFLVAGFFLGLGSFGEAYAVRALVAAPGSLPAGRVLASLSNTVWPIPIAMLILLLLLFPTGRLPSRR